MKHGMKLVTSYEWSCSGISAGPSPFPLYISDLVNSFESTASLFADDIKMYRTIRTGANMEDLQQDIMRLDEWSDKWLLSFNVEKCTLCTITNKQATN